MMKTGKQELTLAQLATYQIKVPGKLDENWQEWTGVMRVSVRSEGGVLVTTLTGRFDQATLQGLLRRLYFMGVPLISVTYLDLV